MSQETTPRTITLGPNDVLIRVTPEADVDMNDVLGEISSALEYSNFGFTMVTAKSLEAAEQDAANTGERTPAG